MSAPVVVLGATGQVGLFAVAGLLEAGREVLAVTRKAAGQPETGIEGLRRVGIEAFAGSPRGAEVAGLQRPALLSCGPVSLARQVLEAAPGAGAPGWQRVVLTGTTSTRVKQQSPDVAERDMIRDIDRGLDAIRDHCTCHAIALTILHPTLIYGCGLDQNLSRVYRWSGRLGLVPIATRANGLRQPLHVGDLAATLVRAVSIDPPVPLDSPVCGGSTLAYREMIGLVQAAAGRRRWLVPVPSPVFGIVTGVGKALPGGGGINAEMFRRQDIDQVFDDGPVRQWLGHSPRPFQPTPADFELPPEIDHIRQALL